MRPGQNRCFEIALNCFVYQCGPEMLRVEANARLSPGKLHDMTNPSPLACLDKGSLGLQHPLTSRRDHEGALYAIECRSQRLRLQHIALYDLHRGQCVEYMCLCAIPDQRAHWHLLTGKLANHNRSTYTSCP